ncbi:hypothetical protein O6H91_18G030800 [Diphasiastrum complanatum]|uniref:Uncharacterized protein n=1 Tax=Diphasiastrum complanatum TaxID=34168 RepID=A0ACC2AZN5_DIPCM|nr:hypothetical protein O6H91_18G030800 [Diphasiastrum complanatum]
MDRSFFIFTIITCCIIYSHGEKGAYGQQVRSGAVTIGALVALNSKMGREAKLAMELAVQKVNLDSTVLNGTELRLRVMDENCDALQGAAAAISLFENEVVAIAGPQTSAASHFVAYMGAAAQVPIVSFSATDPNLSENQYDYFLRLANNDRVQMMAIASVVSLYGWREVVALYTNDDYGRSGIEALNEVLIPMGVKILKRLGFSPGLGKTDIGNLLAELYEFGSKIYIVHMEASMSRALFTEAFNLGMISTGFVWIVTEATSNVLDMIYLDDEYLQSVQGILGTRSFIPDSLELQAFLNEWKKLKGTEELGGVRAHLSMYTLYAYDSIWTIANAVRNLLDYNGTISFVSQKPFPDAAGGRTDLSKLKLFKEGANLLQEILQTNFTGIAGKVQFNRSGDVLHPTFEIVNMVGKGLRVVGYWTENSGCTLSLPAAASKSKSVFKGENVQKLQDVIWPGGLARVPQGWIFPTNTRPLLVAVPYKQGYEEFVGIKQLADNVTSFDGFCIDVFKAALSQLPYHVPYSFIPFGNGIVTPSYDELVRSVASKEFDAAVGDIEITKSRSDIVDFTQPYTASGLTVLASRKDASSNIAWAFLQPFTPAMWLTTFFFVLVNGLVMWILEHKKNPEFRGEPKKQIATILWFIFSSLFFVQREDVKSTLGKAALLVWLFFVLIIKSSYTASLGSILTVQQSVSQTPGIQSIINQPEVRIGYQTGSFVKNYLMQLGVTEDRLVNLSSLTNYAVALNNKSVGAIVDELPYVQLFLSSECNFTAAQEFAKGGWGFAFPKGSQLALDLSQALLQLSENGELQRLFDTWLRSSDCSSFEVNTNLSDLTLSSFWGLFLLTGSTSLICCLLYAYLQWMLPTEAPPKH